MVPGSTVIIVPSSSMAFSAFTMIDLSEVADSAAPKAFGTGCAIEPDLPAIAPRKGALRPVWTRTLFPRTCFVNGQRPAIKFMAVERAHRGVGLCVIVYRDERKAARFTGHPVHHQMDFVDGAVLLEQILKIVLGGLKREITYVQFHCV
jgi:hypothetical protein